MAQISDRELYTRARVWWDKRGRRAIKTESNQEEIGHKVFASSKKAPGVVIKGGKVPSLSSGILRGLPWDELNLREKKRIIKVWYDEHIAIPEKEILHQVN